MFTNTLIEPGIDNKTDEVAMSIIKTISKIYELELYHKVISNLVYGYC